MKISIIFIGLLVVLGTGAQLCNESLCTAEDKKPFHPLDIWYEVKYSNGTRERKIFLSLCEQIIASCFYSLHHKDASPTYTRVDPPQPTDS